MIRSLIQEAALSAAKAQCHAEVEPRHVLFALARHFRQRPECEAFLPLAKSALEPSGSSYETPVMSDAAAAMLDTLESDAAGIAALQQAFQTTGDPSGGALRPERRRPRSTPRRRARSKRPPRSAAMTGSRSTTFWESSTA